MKSKRPKTIIPSRSVDAQGHLASGSGSSLQKSCVFCNPHEHMQHDQVLLRSDHFYLFAGIGPIVEGYIIIAPYRCDWKTGGIKTISEAPTELLDELLFLRGLVTRYYRDAYGFEGGLCFEHGRAGTCGIGDTWHCYHAHLCCFPVSEPIWKDVEVRGRRVLNVSNLGELGATVGKNAYLLIHNLAINMEVPKDAAQRESWESRVVVLAEEMDIERQYLRKLLAKRLNKLPFWDWAATPQIPAVNSLCHRFQVWLRAEAQLPVKWQKGGPPQMAFLDGVRACNSHAYDSIANDYHKTWGKLAPSMLDILNEFCTFTRQSKGQIKVQTPKPRLLDAGCGTGIHLEAFHRAGFDCLGIDSSAAMFAIAASRFRTNNSHSNSAQVQLRKQDAFDLEPFDEQFFDAIWYSALLVHLPRRFAQTMINHLYRILKPGGIVYISAQSGGDAVFRNERRFFVYYTEQELEAKFRSAGFQILKRWHDTTHKGACGDRRTKYWINYFLTRSGR